MTAALNGRHKIRLIGSDLPRACHGASPDRIVAVMMNVTGMVLTGR